MKAAQLWWMKQSQMLLDWPVEGWEYTASHSRMLSGQEWQQSAYKTTTANPLTSQSYATIFQFNIGLLKYLYNFNKLLI